MKTEVQIDVQDLDHLGIITGIVDENGTSMAVHGKYIQLEEAEIESIHLA